MEAIDPNGQEPLENIFTHLRYERGYDGHIIALEPNAKAKNRMEEYFTNNGMTLIKSVDFSKGNGYSPSVLQPRMAFLREVASLIKAKIGTEPLLPGEEKSQSENPLFATGLSRLSNQASSTDHRSLDDYKKLIPTMLIYF